MNTYGRDGALKNNGAQAKKGILLIHNKYLQSGGEDTVVKSELDALLHSRYMVYYKEYSNHSFEKRSFSSVFLPISLFFNFKSFFDVFALVKKHRIAVVHVHNFFYNASPAVFWGAKLAGAKTVMTLHNYRLFCLNHLFFREGQACFECHNSKSFKKGISYKCFKSSTLFSRALAWATLFHRKIGTWRHKVDTFVIINPFAHRLLQDIEVAAEKIVFKPNFLKDQGFKNYNNRENFYLFAGRLEEEKGIRHLALAFARMPHPLLVAGEGSLASLVSNHPSVNLEYRGLLPGAEIKRLLFNCKALIFPSLCLEGMPMTILEAMGAGAIVIAARSASTERLVKDGETGFLYEGGNIEALIKVIDTFEALNVEALNRMSANARNRFLQEYTETWHLKAMEEIYGG